MAIPRFVEELENSSGMKLQLKINDNHSTMLSVKWEPDCTKVSLHRMFLQAPRNVMDSLACYLKREDEMISSSIKSFIEENVQKLDYSHLLDKKKMYTQGNLYNLQKIYDDLNEEYFHGKLKLSITWFGKRYQRNKTRVTFGLYHESLKLIKIHYMLDSPSFPEYLIYYIVYHEMLHHVCPSYYDKEGLHRIHSKEFKQKEELFKHYQLAQDWIRKNGINLFAETD